MHIGPVHIIPIRPTAHRPTAVVPHQLSKTPRRQEHRVPTEWKWHQGTWLSWPHNIETWPGNLDSAQLALPAPSKCWPKTKRYTLT